MSPLASLQELYTTLAEELDFEHEGHNLERCGREMAVFPWLYVPVVEWHLTSKRVLTAEWIDGCKVTDRAAITAMGLMFADVRAPPLTPPPFSPTPCILLFPGGS